MAKRPNRPIAVFKRPRTIGNYIKKARKVTKLIGDNTPDIFDTPPGKTLADVNGDIDKLETAETVAGTRVAGSAQKRDIKYDIVDVDMLDLLGWVQSMMDNAVDELTAKEICAASGFELRATGTRVKPELAAKDGADAGTVKLTAKSAGPNTIYEWQESLDGIVWVDLDPTTVAKTIATGVTSGVKHYYRFRTIKNGVKSKWSVTVFIYPS